VFLLVDARHGIKAVDGEIMALLDRSAVTFQVVLTKADKPGAAALAATIAGLGAGLAKHPAAFPEVLATSAETGRGLTELRAVIAGMA
jgi:GTP-binding protein